MTPIADSFALVLTGGGACAAYQVGVLRCLARHLPTNAFDVITGVSAGAPAAPGVRGLVDTTPLRHLLERLFAPNEKGKIAGIAENIVRCHPRAASVTALDYTTGKTVTWASGCDIEMWTRES